jgi:hypothetical protein
MGFSSSEEMYVSSTLQWSFPYCIEPVPKAALSKHNIMQL